jgi:hypothetical protein
MTGTTPTHWQQSESGLLLPDRPEKVNKNNNTHHIPALYGEDAMNLNHNKAPSDGGPVPSIGRPGHLGIASPFGGDARAPMDTLARAGLSSASLPLHTIESENAEAVAGWLENNAQRHCVIFWQSPVTALAQAMAEGQAPDEALAEWTARAENVLVAVRKNRRRTTLIESTLGQANPGELIERLNQRLDLSLITPSNTANTPEEHDPVELLIAERAVVTNTQARRLAQELQATSLPLGQGDEDLLPDSLTAWHGYQQHGNTERAEAERLRAQNRELRQEQQKLKTQLDELKGKADLSQSGEYQDLKEENDLLLQQLHHVQEELESYYLGSRDIQQKYDKAEAERKKLERSCNAALQRAGMLQKKIDSMRASRSWRLTKPLRVGNFLKRKKAK